jgi:DNA-binding IclR family transcriptional regulator
MSEVKAPPKIDSTLSKGLGLLEALAQSPTGVGVTDLAGEMGLTKSNTFRLLQTLKALGYVKLSDDKLYSASLKAWQIGRQCIDNINLRDIAAPEMNQLSRETGETIYLAVQENLSVVYIDMIDSVKPIRSWNRIGGSAPLHCVGTGKALLASNYDVLRNSVKHQLTQYTDKTITTISALDNDIKLAQANNYAFDQGEFRDRILSFGASIHLPDGETIAALGVSLPDINMPINGEANLGRLVADAAASVSRKLSSS